MHGPLVRKALRQLQEHPKDQTRTIRLGPDIIPNYSPKIGPNMNPKIGDIS